MKILLCRISYPKISAIGFIEFFKSPAPLTKMLFREKRVKNFYFRFLIKNLYLNQSAMPGAYRKPSVSKLFNKLNN